MQARILPATRGAFWVAAGFLLYRRNPPLLSTLTFANMMLALLFSQLQPVGPFLLLLLSPLVVALIANACAAIGQGGSAPFRELLKGLREHRLLLLRLGMLQMVFVMIAVAIFDRLLPGVDPDVLISAKDAAGKASVKIDTDELLLLLLHLALVAGAVLPAFWFAPLLTAWHGVSPLKSVFFSLVAVWRNWRAFLVYVMTTAIVGVFVPSLLLLVLGQLSSSLSEIFSVVLRMLLLLVFAPVLMTSAYLGYRDVFDVAAQETDATPGAETETAADAKQHE